MVLLIGDEEVRRIFTMKDCIDALEEGYIELAHGRAVNMPRRDTYVPYSQKDSYYVFKTMEGTIQKLGVVAQRVDSVIQQWPIVNGALKKLQLPNPRGRYVGLIYLYNIEDQELLAVIPDGEVGRMRVAGTMGLGVKLLDRGDSKTAGIYGSGWQAGALVRALVAARSIHKVKIYSPNREHRVSFAQKYARELGLDITAVDEPAQAAQGVDIVGTATNSREPVCKGAWIERGTHLTCLEPWEFDDDAWGKCDRRFFSSLASGYMAYVIGDKSSVPEFSSGKSEDEIDRYYERFGGDMVTDLLRGKVSGRRRDEEIIMMCKGTGLGIEFAATAKRVYDLARAKGVGLEISGERFTQLGRP